MSTAELQITERPARGAWSAVLAFAAVAGITQMLWLTYTPITTGTAAHYGVSKPAVSLLATVYPLIYVILAIPIGLALDRRPRTTMLIGALLTVGGAWTRVLPGGYAPALVGQILVSFGQPVLLNGVTVVAARRLPASSRSAGIAAGSAGVFIGVLVGVVLPAAFGAERLHALLVCQGVITLVGVLWMLATLGPKHVNPPEATQPGFSVVREVFRDRSQRLLLLLAFSGFGVFGALLQELQPLLKPSGVSVDTAGIVVFLMVLAGVITSSFVPVLASKRGKERQVLRAALPAAGVCCLLLAFSPPIAITAALLMLSGALLLPALPVLLEIAERRMPHASGSASAAIWLAGNFGAFAVAVPVSLLLGTPAAAFVVLALFVILIGVPAGSKLRPEDLEPVGEIVPPIDEQIVTS